MTDVGTEQHDAHNVLRFHNVKIIAQKFVIGMSTSVCSLSWDVINT